MQSCRGLASHANSLEPQERAESPVTANELQRNRKQEDGARGRTNWASGEKTETILTLNRLHFCLHTHLLTNAVFYSNEIHLLSYST